MIIHFEFDGPASWEAMGSGVGDGEDHIAVALTELRDLHGGRLPAGRYRFIEARGGDARWGRLELDADGRLLT